MFRWFKRPNPHTLQRLGILRMGGLGDVMNSLIMATALKQAYPHIAITYITDTRWASLVEALGCVDSVIAFDEDQRHAWQPWHTLIQQLRQAKLEFLFPLQNNLRWFLLACTLFPWRWAKRQPHGPHSTDAFFRTLQRVFPTLTEKPCTLLPNIPTLPSPLPEACQALPQPWLLCCPSGQNDGHRQGRTWPMAYWQALIQQWLDTSTGSVVIIGSTSEAPEHACLRTLSPQRVHVRSGLDDIVNTARLLQEATMIVTGDSGPLHMAAALQRPTLALMGSTRPEHCGGYSPTVQTLQQTLPAHKDNQRTEVEPPLCVGCEQKRCAFVPLGTLTPCMEGIPPQQVWGKLKAYATLPVSC